MLSGMASTTLLSGVTDPIRGEPRGAGISVAFHDEETRASRGAPWGRLPSRSGSHGHRRLVRPFGRWEGPRPCEPTMLQSVMPEE